MIFQLNIVIFHSYVKWPEGTCCERIRNAWKILWSSWSNGSLRSKWANWFWLSVSSLNPIPSQWILGDFAPTPLGQFIVHWHRPKSWLLVTPKSLRFWKLTGQPATNIFRSCSSFNNMATQLSSGKSSRWGKKFFRCCVCFPKGGTCAQWRGGNKSRLETQNHCSCGVGTRKKAPQFLVPKIGRPTQI